MTSKLKFIFLIVPFLLFNCAPLPIYTLSSKEKNKDFLMGRETIIKEDSGLKLSLNFERYERKNFLFFLVVENKTDDTIIVNPAKIYEEILEPNVDKTVKKSFAINPENQLLKIDKQINKTEAQKKTSDGLNLFISALGLASDISSIGKEKSQKEIKEREHIRRQHDRNMRAEETEYQDKMNGLYVEKNHWENNVLRITTLHPGERIGGLIYLPVNRSASIIKLVIPINHREINFIYEQTKI